MNINTENIKIRLCNSNDIDSIHNIENILIDNVKKNEKGYFLPFKKAVKSMIAFNMQNKTHTKV